MHQPLYNSFKRIFVLARQYSLIYCLHFFHLVYSICILDVYGIEIYLTKLLLKVKDFGAFFYTNIMSILCFSF